MNINGLKFAKKEGITFWTKGVNWKQKFLLEDVLKVSLMSHDILWIYILFPKGTYLTKRQIQKRWSITKNHSIRFQRGENVVAKGSWNGFVYHREGEKANTNTYSRYLFFKQVHNLISGSAKLASYFWNDLWCGRNVLGPHQFFVSFYYNKHKMKMLLERQ